jgi:acyl-[acyl-carrier-protein]-phospholipid O-acyltransferase/long-chain-fatty-acid--[acyl-carrier-protein] ligase
MLRLLVSRRFAPLFWCQFLSAFNDNFLKTSLVFLIAFRLAGGAADLLVTAAGAVFILPFFFLSGLGGEWADRYDKALVARRLKFAEIFASLFACLGFVLHSVPLLFVALFLFGVIAALFGPVKYGILPDHLAKEDLPAGNALVEGATFLAILSGTILAGLAAREGGDPAHFTGIVMGAALLCWLSARLIPPTGAKALDLAITANPLASTRRLLQELRSDLRLYLGAIYTSWFWTVGAVAMALLPGLVKTGLGGDEGVVTAFLAVFAVAIALGSGLAAWLVHGRVALLPVAIGGGLMALACLALALTLLLASAGPGATVAAGAALALLAVGGGLFIVPSFAAVQVWSDEERRARVVAGVNILNAGWMVAGAAGLALLQALGLGLQALFGLLGFLNLLMTALVLRTMPTDPRIDWAIMRGRG